ncbi:DUF4340 domain-containing protein [Thiogranum longum]
MKSRWFINILLLLAIGALILVARYEPGIEEEPQTPAVTTLSKDQVRRIHINRPVRDDLVLAKDAHDNWTIERAPALPADKLQVNALVKLAEQKAIRSYPVSELDLAKLELDPPYATMVLNDTAIEFGSLDPLEGLRYLRVADRVHLVPNLYQHLIDADYTQFVRRRLFDDNASIARISLPDFSVTMEDGKWTVQPQREVSADTLQRFVEAWQNASALHTKAAGKQQTDESIEVVLQHPEQRIAFLIAATEPELVLIRQDFGIQFRMGALGSRLLELNQPAPNDQQ